MSEDSEEERTVLYGESIAMKRNEHYSAKNNGQYFAPSIPIKEICSGGAELYREEEILSTILKQFIMEKFGG